MLFSYILIMKMHLFGGISKLWSRRLHLPLLSLSTLHLKIGHLRDCLTFDLFADGLVFGRFLCRGSVANSVPGKATCFFPSNICSYLHSGSIIVTEHVLLSFTRSGVLS